MRKSVRRSNTALETTVTGDSGRNHSLCHGDLGNLELLVQAGQSLDDPRWMAEALRRASIGLDGVQRHGWLCGWPLGVETPGLMTGLAGIGYELLRLADPMLVPSVLSLEGPAYSPLVRPREEGTTGVWTLVSGEA